MKKILLYVIGLMLIPLMAACKPTETVRAIAPETAAAFENEGLFAAIDTFTGHIVITCGEIDGKKVQIDVVAEAFNGANTIEKAREVRKDICDTFIAANDLTNAFLGDPEPVDSELSPPKAPPG